MRTRWYRQVSFLNEIRFALLHGVPISEAVVDFRIPVPAKRRMKEALDGGAGLRKAFEDAGVPAREAALLDLKGGVQAASFLLDVNIKASRLTSSIHAMLAESFSYPNVVAMLTVASWLFLRYVGLPLKEPISNLAFVLSLLVLLGMQVIFFLPWYRIPYLSRISLLKDAQILFGYLRFSFSRGIDEITAVREAIEDVGLFRAIGGDACNRLNAGIPFLRVLAEMPAVKAVRFGIPPTEQAQSLMETLERAAELEWTSSTATLRLLLRTAALLVSGMVLMALAVQVFLVMYAPGMDV